MYVYGKKEKTHYNIIYKLLTNAKQGSNYK